MKKKLLLVSTLLITLVHSAWAYDFQKDGWLYDIISNANLTVRIVGRGSTLSGEVDIPASVTYNGITFNVTEIGNYACFSLTYNGSGWAYDMYQNRLYNATTINIPNTITTIGDSAFAAGTGYGGMALLTLNIAGSVTSIGSHAFDGCSSLTSINFNSTTPPSIGTGAFNGVPLYAFVYTPCGTSSAYSNNSQLNQFSHFVEEGVYGIVTLQQTTGGTIEMTQEPTCTLPSIITATPATSYSFPAYDFVSWSDGDTNNPRSLYVTSDTLISAIFTPRQFYNIAEVFDSTQGYAVGDTAYFGDTAIFTAYPYHGYVFSLWKAYNSSTHQWFTFSNENPYYRVMDYSLRLRAEFTPAQYTVTVQSNGGGTVYVGSSGNNTGSFNYLSSAYVYATPSTGYRFVMWSDSSEFASRYITVRGDTTLSAVFASIESLRDTIYVHDTTVVYHADTLWLHDTIIIHDTVYITQEGIDGVDVMNAKVYSSQGQILVEGADGNTVTFFDINGRMLATKRDDYSPLRFDVPASGTYMIKIGKHAARKVVVIR